MLVRWIGPIFFSITIHPHTINCLNWEPGKSSDHAIRKNFLKRERSDFPPILVIQYGLIEVGLLEVTEKVKVLQVGLIYAAIHLVSGQVYAHSFLAKHAVCGAKLNLGFQICLIFWETPWNIVLKQMTSSNLVLLTLYSNDLNIPWEFYDNNF